jgi:hypothetical protein
MATTTTTPPARPGTETREVRIYSHSALFYWWPVWACGYIMAIWTAIDGHRLAIVPPGTTVTRNDGDFVLHTKGKLNANDQMIQAANSDEHQFRQHVAQNSRLGVVFVIVLLLVILITNVPLRGLWSVVVIITIALTAIILALADWWDRIFESLGHLHIHANLAYYLFLSTGLLLMWLISVFFFDRQTYMIFTPSQLRVCTEIGSGETAYDTTGMSIEKHRYDLFRHWILGLGSGDMTIKTSGAQAHTFEMHNVLNVSSKLRAIEDMQRERPTVQGKS